MVPGEIMAGMRGAWLDLLLPPACFRCGRAGDDPLCTGCLRTLPPVGPAPPVTALAAVVAGAAYSGEVEALVRRFKYPASGMTLDPAPEAVLTALLVRAVSALPSPDLVIPVPLHPNRLRARGFNPAGRLARRLARARGLPFDPMALRRVRDTPSQTGLDARARRRNVARAFQGSRATLPRSVWLVDDVVTTGNTLDAAARALRRADVAVVIGVAAAATP